VPLLTRLGNAWPNRMAHQLSLLLLLALLASNLIAMLFLQSTGSLLHPLSRQSSLERLVIAHHAALALNALDSTRLLQAMGDADSRFWIAAQADVAPNHLRREESRLAATLGARLDLAVPVRVQLERSGGGDARAHPFSRDGWAALRLRTSIALPDGRFLNALQHPVGAYEWGRMLAYSLPVTTLPVLLIVMMFMARVLRPIRLLAQATERVSRGEWIAPLALTGPQEARDLTGAFNTMQVSIARHVEGRTRMLAAISHDLNTPITELRLQLELLEPGELRDDLMESLDQLRGMVRETLDFVRGDALPEPTILVSLTGLLDDLAKRYSLMGRPLDWAGAEPVTLHCRPLALKRALTNLIDNALQHAGDAALSLHLDEPDRLRVEILDRGPGLPREWLEKVFEPFVQLGRDGATPHQGGGLGLGLAIARSCIQAHGGELSLENRLPAGLCAVVRLPRAIAPSVKSCR
jgi:signal transduction histidine kinase